MPTKSDILQTILAALLHHFQSGGDLKHDLVATALELSSRSLREPSSHRPGKIDLFRQPPTCAP